MPIKPQPSRASPTRERRIVDEIIVDANGPEEQAMGWYYYLEERLRFPFAAQCRAHRATSPLRVNETVIVSAMAPEDECEHEMLVEIRWQNRSLAVPLAQLDLLKPGTVTDEAREAIADWHYWTARGYQL